MNTPLLSICIPTFNNPEGIRNAIMSLSAQATAAGITERIEICIRDNSEDVQTKNIVEGFADSPVSILYKQNEENVGYDRNVDRVLSMATGMFCWLLSDNEALKETTLAAVFKAAEDAPEAGHILIAPASVPKENIRKYASFEEAIHANGYWIPGGLVSRNIFARKYIPQNREPYFGNDWLHLSLAFEIGKDHPVYFIEEQFDEDLETLSSWAKNGKTFRTYTNLLKIVTNLPTPYTSQLIKTLGDKMRKRLPREILSAKLYGLEATRENFDRLKESLVKHPLLLALSAIALIIPVSFIGYAKRIKHSSHY